MLRKNITSNSREVILPFFSTLSSGSTGPPQCCIQFWASQDKEDGDSDIHCQDKKQWTDTQMVARHGPGLSAFANPSKKALRKIVGLDSKVVGLSRGLLPM